MPYNSPFAAPQVDFSILAKLPELYQQGIQNAQERDKYQQQQDLLNARKAALAKFDGSNFADLSKSLFAAGDLEGGLQAAKLLNNGGELTPEIKNFQFAQTHPEFATQLAAKAPISAYDKAKQEADAKAQVTSDALSAGGKRVIAMTDALAAKVGNPEFSKAVGPYINNMSDAPVGSLSRNLYEYWQGPKSKAFLDEIKQSAQAINSVMQRELLKGGGSITNEERANISRILGAIAAARSPEEAIGLLNNFKHIVGNMFGISDLGEDYALPSTPTQPENALGTGPAEASAAGGGSSSLEPGKTVVGGYLYKGGNPSDQNSWVKK